MRAHKYELKSIIPYTIVSKVVCIYKVIAIVLQVSSTY